MANVAALLGNYLATSADINYYVQQQAFWCAKYEANAEKVAKWSNYETTWYDKEEKCADSEEGKTYKGKTYTCEQSEDYATAVVKHNINDIRNTLDELTEKDIEYETIKNAIETQLELLRAEKDAQKSATSNAAQDTGLLGQ